MVTHYPVWGSQQLELYQFGTMADADGMTIRWDCSMAVVNYAGASYSIRIRRADGVKYQAADSLEPDAENRIEYVLTQQDLVAPGALWLTLTATLGPNAYEWSCIGWVRSQAYDGGYGQGSPLWAQALLAMLDIDNGAHNITTGGGGSGEGGMSAHGLTLTIAPEAWQSGEATISNAGVSASAEGYLTLPTGASQAQYYLFAAAKLRVAAQAAGALTLAAGGTVPTSALTVHITQFI